MTLVTDYLSTVRHYAPNADEAVIKRIIRHLGIALQSRDGSLVACSDASERARVRDKWLKRKLCITDDDASMDAAIREVCQTMKADHHKCRVVFYYLLAEKYGRLSAI